MRAPWDRELVVPDPSAFATICWRFSTAPTPIHGPGQIYVLLGAWLFSNRESRAELVGSLSRGLERMEGAIGGENR